MSQHAPFNAAAHDFLVNNGYTHEFYEAEWDDVGGPESGPKIVGHPAIDVYSPVDRSQCQIAISDDGNAELDPYPAEFYDNAAEQF